MPCKSARCFRPKPPPPTGGRIGEARKRGSEVFSANVSSLWAAWDRIAQASWDIAFIQEARVGPDSPVREEVRRNKLTMFLSRPGDDGKSLLAVLVRNGSCSRIPAVHSDRTDGVLWYRGGGHSYRFYHVYAEADGTQAALQLNSKMVRDCLVDAEGQGRSRAAFLATATASSIIALPAGPVGLRVGRPRH